MKKNKLRYRVPRASNLIDLKRLLLNLQEKQQLKELLDNNKFKKESYLIEYIKLFKLLGLIDESYHHFLLTEKGKDVKFEVSNEDILTKKDKDILKNCFNKLEIVSTFLENIYDFNINQENYPFGVCLTKEEIKKRYLSYRDVSESVAERESRFIYNWLVDLDVIESLSILSEKNKNFHLCYHIIGNDVAFELFGKKIKLTIFLIMKERKKRDWIEIPEVRNSFCNNNSISKEQFNNLFIEYIKKHPLVLQLSTGSLLRKEVEKDGIEINNKLYFYVKLTRGIL